jgi:threonine/homoserine efflux transporter RhtA
MKKIWVGLAVGAGAGVLDVIPMIAQGLTWDSNISAFTLWIVVGVFIASSSLKMKGILKGMLISFLTIIPTAVLIGWKEPISLIPVGIMTAILGSFSGYLIEKYSPR